MRSATSHACAVQEPELLRADGDRVRRQMQELAVQQYGAFISAAECTAAVHSEVAGIREHLDALLQARLPTRACLSLLHCCRG